MNAPKKARVCPDCPAVRAGLFDGLVDRASGCAFRCLPVEARQPLPARWRGEYALALVRRGILVRQRIDGAGRATAIDIAGPGSTIPIAALSDDGASAYAVDDVLLCLAPSPVLEGAIADGGAGARDVVRAQVSMLERVERIAQARSRASATSRVASLLVAIADTLSPARRLTSIPPAIQQRDFAALLALRHESVCRSVASLETRGLVARNAQGLLLVDRAALEAL